MAMSFNFVLTGSKSGIGSSSTENESSIISDNTNSSDNQPSLITSTDENCIDGFAGKDIMGTFDESKVTPAIMESAETIGSVAYSAETIGSVAIDSSETAGSVACSDGSGGDFSGGGDSGFSSFG